MPMGRSEKKWILLFSLGLVILTSIPYFLGFACAQGSTYSFSGFIFGVDDGNSYLAKMLLGQGGDWLFRTPYTAYPQNGFLAFFPYLLLGKLASPPATHLQLIALFHLARCLGIWLLVFESYSFARLFLPQANMVKAATVLALLGGGLGWLDILIRGSLPLEFYSPESFGFLSILGLPHLCFSRALMFRSMRMILEPGKDLLGIDRKVSSGITLLICGLFQPLNIPLAWLLVGVWKAYRVFVTKAETFAQAVRQLIYFIAIPLPFFVYNSFMFLFDPYLKTWENQNIIKSAPVWDYLFAYGIGYLCLLVVHRIQKTRIQNSAFLVIWAVLLPLLIYLPFNLQRRLADGFWVVLCIYIVLATQAVHKSFYRSLLYGVLCLSTLLFYMGSLLNLGKMEEPVYIPNPAIAVYAEIEQNGAPGDVVLAPFQESNTLPAFARNRVITGHGPESKNSVEIEPFVEDFYRGLADDAQINAYIAEFDIRFVIFNKTTSPGGQQRFEQAVDAEMIYENSGYTLFQTTGTTAP